MILIGIGVIVDQVVIAGIAVFIDSVGPFEVVVMFEIVVLV